MGKPGVSRDAFRGLFAFYAAKTHHDHKPEAEHSLLRMFGSADDIPDTLLRQWSDRVELLGSETVCRYASTRPPNHERQRAIRPCQRLSSHAAERPRA
jgi:hypothetical protein